LFLLVSEAVSCISEKLTASKDEVIYSVMLGFDSTQHNAQIKEVFNL
jgi:hypothetical protein